MPSAVALAFRFGYNPTTRSGVTYIRHTDEESVYAIDGFLSFSVNQPFSGWRNKTFITGNKDNWNSLTFTYPGDSSFMLVKQNNKWIVNGTPADSGKAEQYLNALANMQNSSFVDQFSPSSTAIYTLTIQGNNQSAPINVLAYPTDSTQKFILHSSLNNDAYFNDGQSHEVENIFVSSKSFFH